MQGAVDATKRPLKIPSKYIPYMEKNRIYELFHEIAKQLIIEKPNDHISFMKQFLERTERFENPLKIVILSPPDFDTQLLGEYLKKTLKIKCVSPKDLESSDFRDNFLDNMRKKLYDLCTQGSGWILFDFPRNAMETRDLQRSGILPSHVVKIIWSESNCPSEKKSSFTSFDNPITYSENPSTNHLESNSQESIFNMGNFGILDDYNNVLTVETAGRTHEELGQAIINLSKKKKQISPCYNFRIVLIGPRGSGRRYIAKYLASKYNIEYIDFVYLQKQKLIQNSMLSKDLRSSNLHYSKSIERGKIIENKLSSYECLKKGWVLIGYPITVEDFQILDLLPTAPNRIIFLSIDKVICEDRLLYQNFNVFPEPPGFTVEKLESHLNDYNLQVKQDINEYFENIEKLLEYAGKSADIIDASYDGLTVKEKVDSCLAKDAPFAPPRTVKPQIETRPSDIEFEPSDDSPGLKILIKQFESAGELAGL